MQPPHIGPNAPFFIVLNAGSGSESAVEARQVIEEGFAAAGRRHRIFLVDGPGRVQALAREAVERARAVGGVVVAAGGDGTINAVAQATLGSGCAFGVLPQGTFNYFSRTHGIPRDTAEALQVLLGVLRDSGAPQQVVAHAGQYSQSLPAGRLYRLLRVRLEKALELVPEISGHRLMVLVRLMRQEPDGRLRASEEDSSFELTLCA